MESRKHLFRGEQKTILEIAQALGLSETTVHRRIKNGQPLTPGRFPRGGATNGYTSLATKFEFRGEMLTLKEIAVITGLTYDTCRRRHDGKTFYEDCDDARVTEAETYTCDGETLTLSQWSERTGIRWQTLYSRIYFAHWPVKKALTTPIKPPRSYTLNGITDTLKGWSARSGIAFNTLYERINNSHWPLEKALTTPPLIDRRKPPKADESNRASSPQPAESHFPGG